MSDLINGMDAKNGRSTIFNAGLVVVNGKEDHHEIDTRAGITSQFAHRGKAHFIYPKELCFVRKDKIPARSNDSASIQSEIEVFTNLAGITETENAREATEKNYALVGITRNRPRHQDMEGRDRGGRFAIIMAGLVTIRCQSLRNIPVMTPLVWRAPRNPNNDPKNLGRALAEIEPYNPVQNGINSLQVHENLHKIMGSPTYALHDDTGAGRDKQADSVIFDQLLAIAYTGALMAIDQMGGGQGLTDADKLLVAEIMGLATPDTPQANKRAIDFRKNFADSVFGARFDAASGTSQTSDDNLAFPIARAGIDTEADERKHQIARVQAAQFDRLAKAFFMKDRSVRDRIFGISMSSGKPGGDIDILMTRP